MTFAKITQHALNRGLAIHPLERRGKKPLLTNWPARATRDEETIANWSKLYPDSNYGVAADDTYCVLESDNFVELTAHLSKPLPKTYTVQARSARPHLYFRQTPISRAAGNLDCPGVFEFKQKNRYVVGEGSTHPTGATYDCIDDSPIAEFPEWLAEDLERIVATVRRKMATEGRHPAIMRWCALNWKGPGYADDLIQGAIRFDEENNNPPRGWKHAQECAEWFIRNDKEPTQEPGKVFLKGTLHFPEPPVVSAKHEFVLGPYEGSRHGVFALGSVHLIAGSSGAGKTTVGLQLLEAQAAGEEFFDCETYSRPYHVIMQDRSQRELDRSFENLRFDRSKIPHTALSTEEEQLRPDVYVNGLLLGMNPERRPQVVFIEGLDIWIQEPEKLKVVSPVLGYLRRVAEQYNIAIIATVGSPKMKERERYELSRDCIFGSSVWGRRADSIVLLTHIKDKPKERSVTIETRTASQRTIRMEFEDGRLMPKNGIVVGPARTWTAKELIDLGVPERTAYRWAKYPEQIDVEFRREHENN